MDRVFEEEGNCFVDGEKVNKKIEIEFSPSIDTVDFSSLTLRSNPEVKWTEPRQGTRSVGIVLEPVDAGRKGIVKAFNKGINKRIDKVLKGGGSAEQVKELESEKLPEMPGYIDWLIGELAGFDYIPILEFELLTQSKYDLEFEFRDSIYRMANAPNSGKLETTNYGILWLIDLEINDINQQIKFIEESLEKVNDKFGIKIPPISIDQIRPGQSFVYSVGVGVRQKLTYSVNTERFADVYEGVNSIGETVSVDYETIEEYETLRGTFHSPASLVRSEMVFEVYTLIGLQSNDTPIPYEVVHQELLKDITYGPQLFQPNKKFPTLGTLTKEKIDFSQPHFGFSQ